ncbi:MAG: SH3 domain-containing protein [Acidobacteriota bacterium]|nr:MAG: SH3 domain-containing protein [Acidobacteriota bacterium]
MQPLRLFFAAVVLFASPLALGADLPAKAATAQAVLEEANALYEEGNFSEAAARYARLLEAGYASAPLYYNLGCAEYKAGNPGRAAWAFEQTLLRAPRDREARENLFLLREQTADRVPEESAVEIFLGYLYRLLPPSAALPALIALVWVLSTAGTLYYVSRRETLLYTLLAGGAAAVVLAAWLGAGLAYAELIDRGVVLEAVASVKSGPRESHPTVFELHAATPVRITGRRGEWLIIRLADGREGWLPAASVGILGLP